MTKQVTFPYKGEPTISKSSTTVKINKSTKKQEIFTNAIDSATLPILDAEPLVDLRKYDQSWYKRGRPTWFVFLWWLVQGVAFPLSPHPFNGFRVWLLRLFGAKIGKKVVIRPSSRFTYPWKVKIGDYSWIGDDVVFYSLDQIQIGNHCVISQKCYLCTGNHDIQDPTFRLMTAPITIGNGVWVTTDCFVAPGVQIGANSVVGVRSSVLSNLPTQWVCWGTPARPRYRRQVNS